MAKTESFRNWFIRLYGDIEQVILFVTSKCKHYAFIYHDQDVYTKNDENHCIGDKKVPHWHLCVNVEKCTRKQLQRNLDIFFGSGAKNSLIRPMNRNVDKAVEYLEHKNNPEKYQYDHSLVKSDDYDFWFTEEVKKQIAQDKEDTMLKFYEDIVDNGLTYRKLDSYIKQYGRDFLFNWKRVFETAALVHKYKNDTDFDFAVSVEEVSLSSRPQAEYYMRTPDGYIMDSNGVLYDIKK